jgi:hypothetical protein
LLIAELGIGGGMSALSKADPANAIPAVISDVPIALVTPSDQFF